MSKRGGMSRGGGPKIGVRSPPAAAPSVGASGFTDGGVASALQQNMDSSSSANPNAVNTRAVAGPAVTAKFYDKFDGSATLERLYERKEDAVEVEYRGVMYKPNPDKAGLLRKIEAIANGSK